MAQELTAEQESPGSKILKEVGAGNFTSVDQMLLKGEQEVDNVVCGRVAENIVKWLGNENNSTAPEAQKQKAQDILFKLAYTGVSGTYFDSADQKTEIAQNAVRLFYDTHGSSLGTRYITTANYKHATMLQAAERGEFDIVKEMLGDPTLQANPKHPDGTDLAYRILIHQDEKNSKTETYKTVSDTFEKLLEKVVEEDKKSAKPQKFSKEFYDLHEQKTAELNQRMDEERRQTNEMLEAANKMRGHREELEEIGKQISDSGEKISQLSQLPHTQENFESIGALLQKQQKLFEQHHKVNEKYSKNEEKEHSVSFSNVGDDKIKKLLSSINKDPQNQETKKELDKAIDEMANNPSNKKVSMKLTNGQFPDMKNAVKEFPATVLVPRKGGGHDMLVYDKTGTIVDGVMKPPSQLSDKDQKALTEALASKAKTAEVVTTVSQEHSAPTKAPVPAPEPSKTQFAQRQNSIKDTVKDLQGNMTAPRPLTPPQSSSNVAPKAPPQQQKPAPLPPR